MSARAAAFAVCAVVSLGFVREAVCGPEARGLPETANFQEVAWPFEVDQWGKGRAFRCAPADCGAEVNVYVRAKIGFCNCTTGVSDDIELDRVGDVSLLSDAYVPLRDGEPVRLGWMSGRKRLYDAAPRYASKQNALAVAFNDQCDVIVATVTSKRQVSASAEQAAIAFLKSDTVLMWAKKELGL
ncbi:MAG: hypothetical protein ACXWLD_10985 [Rhizomicrobium sp.]